MPEQRPIGLAILLRSATADPLGVSRVSAMGIVRFAMARKLALQVVEFDQPDAAASIERLAADPSIDLIWAYGTTAEALPRPTGPNLKPWFSIIANPPFYPDALKTIRLPDNPRYLVCIDRDMPEFIARLGVEGAITIVERPAFQGELHAAASSALADRPIVALWAGTYRPPEQYLANLSRTPAPFRRLVDDLIDAADADFARPLWAIADEVVAHSGIDFPITDPRGLLALEAVNRFLTMRWKARVLHRLSRHPCRLVANALPAGLPIHPHSKVTRPVPFPDFLDLMTRSRGVVGFMPNRMTGAIGERTTNAAARGAVPIVPETPAVAPMRAEGIAIVGYGPDLTAIDAALDALRATPQPMQPAATATAETMRTRFTQADSLDDVLAQALGSRWAAGAER